MTPDLTPRADGAPADGAPVIRVVRGNPTPEQVAAVVAALAAASGPTAEPSRPERTLWTARPHVVHPALPAGSGSWRASGLPR